MRTSRRNFLKLSGAGVLATQAPSIFARDISGNKKLPGADLPFELGIASYTFREFSLEDTINMTSQLGISKLCLKSMHLPLELSLDEIKAEGSQGKFGRNRFIWWRCHLHENQGGSGPGVCLRRSCRDENHCGRSGARVTGLL